MTYRLGSVAPDLVELLITESDSHLRRAAQAVARLAVAKNGLTDRTVDAAIDSLERGSFGETEERSAVIHLTDKLDTVAWDLQDEVESGSASESDYVAAFRRARAAASVGFALDSSPIIAALEAIYEGHAAVGNVDEIRVVVVRALAE